MYDTLQMKGRSDNERSSAKFSEMAGYNASMRNNTSRWIKERERLLSEIRTSAHYSDVAWLLSRFF